MNQTRFKLSRLALSLSLITGAGALAPVSANDDVAATTDVEVIQVTAYGGVQALGIAFEDAPQARQHGPGETRSQHGVVIPRTLDQERAQEGGGDGTT